MRVDENNKAENASEPVASNLPVVIEQRQQSLIEQVLGSVGTTCLHNFPGGKMDQWRMIALAEGGDVMSREDLGASVFPMTYFYAHQVRIVNSENGEISEPTRVVLIDKDHNCVGFVSDGVAKCLSRIIQTFGIGPYDPPIDVMIQEIRTSKKRRMYTLVPA